MCQKFNSTNSRASTKARAATHSADQASSQDVDVPEKVSGDLEETLTEKVEGKEETLKRHAGRAGKFHTQEAPDESTNYEDSDAHESAEHDEDAISGSYEDPDDDRNRDSEYRSQVFEDQSEMTDEYREEIFRPYTPVPFAFSEDEEEKADVEDENSD